MAKRREKENPKQEESCIIIGGGYSIKEQAQAEAIKKAQSYKIACNKSFFDFEADAIAYFDHKFESVYRERIQQFTGGKYAPRNPCYTTNKYEDMDTTYIDRSKEASDRLADGIYTGFNTGTLALSVALCNGYKEIYLAGCDCKVKDNGDTHYHGGYGIVNISNEYYESMIYSFEKVGKFAQDKGVKVFNCSFDSHLSRDIFPYSDKLNGKKDYYID